MAHLPPDPRSGSAYYHRGSGTYGTPEKLLALYEGYAGLNLVFGINVALAIGSNFIGRTLRPGDVVTAYLVVGLVFFVIISVLTYPQNKKIGFGKDWPSSMPVIASLLMGLNSALCCGIIGYMVMQNIALKEMKLYGLTGSFFGGVKKHTVMAKIEEMRRAASQSVPSQASPPAEPPKFDV